jgi:Flp pilus assembly protein TadG
LEFAILAIPFFTWLLFIFEISYDLFTQEALDAALRTAVRQIQTGNANDLSATAKLGAGQVFVQQYLCPAAHGLLECNNNQLSVSIQEIVPSPTQPDFSFFPTAIPIQNGTVVPFDDSLAGNAYCNAQPKTLVLVQALYLGPSFLGGLLPGILSARYGNSIVHPTLSTAGFVVEPYPPNTSSTNPTPNPCGAPPA